MLTLSLALPQPESYLPSGPGVVDGWERAWAEAFSAPLSACSFSPDSAWLPNISAIRDGKNGPALTTPLIRRPPWMMKGTVPKALFSPVPRRCSAARRFPANFSWSPTPASAATRTFTTSGSARCTIFPRSTISGTARASSTCRTPSARGHQNGAGAATIRLCSMRARWIRRSSSSCTLRKLRLASAA